MNTSRKSFKLAVIGAATAGLLGFTAPVAANAAAPEQVAAQQVAPRVLDVTGVDQFGNTFTGQISDLTATVVNGVTNITGTITGTGLPAGGVDFTAPLSALGTNGDACDILTLDLGPLNLDLLGLVVDLAPVNLEVTAEPGPGNLLGNLLCSIAGLLDNGGPVTGITALLNRLLTGLGL